MTEKEKSTIATIIESNLTLNTKLFKENTEELLLELGPIINLINSVGEDPIEVAALLLKTVLAIKVVAASVQYDRDRAHDFREALSGKLYKKYASTDKDVNPYAGTAKLTGSFVEAVVRQEDSFNEADAKYQELKYLSGILYSVKDVLEVELELVKGLILNPGVIPVSGKLIDKEDIEAQVEKFQKLFTQDK